MSKLADYSDIVTVTQLAAALRAGSFEGVFHYLAGDNARRIEDPAIVAGVRALGWPQLGISVPTLGAVSGATDAARAADVYGFGAGFRFALDIEPGEFDQDPAGWARAADGWCDAVRQAGLSPGVYGTDATVAACADHADWIWRAKPGMCDPAGPGLDPAFFGGRRAVQCDQGLFAGVVLDVSYSEFTVGGAMDPAVITWLQNLALELGVGPLPGLAGQPPLIPAPGVTKGGVADLTLTGLATIEAAVAALQPTQLQPVLDAIAALSVKVDALSKHLGVGTP